MPGLLDIPPELIERIHEQYELLLREETAGEHDWESVVQPQLGDFRLVSRCIERAIRRSFIQVWFAEWRLHAPVEANIQKFCTMAKTPDLTASVRSLCLDVDDDYSMRAQEGGSSSDMAKTPDVFAALDVLRLSDKDETSVWAQETDLLGSEKDEATHMFDDVTSALAPVAYLRYKDALIQALCACKNITQMCIHNRILDSDHLNAYKRVSDEVEDVVQDQEQDADDSAGEDSDDENDESDNGDRSDESEESEEPSEDEYETGSDVEDVDQESEDDDTDDDRDHECDRDPNIYELAFFTPWVQYFADSTYMATSNLMEYVWIDITLSFAYIMSLLEDAGAQPKCICTTLLESSNPDGTDRSDLLCGLSDFSAIGKTGMMLRDLQELSLHVMQKRPQYGTTGKEQ